MAIVMWTTYELWEYRNKYCSVVYENADSLFCFPLSEKRNDCIDDTFAIIQHCFSGNYL